MITRILLLVSFFGGLSVAHGQLSSETLGQRLPISDENLSFQFYPQDGQYSLECKHQANPVLPGDWDIRCEDASGPWGAWKFRAHVLVRKYLREDGSSHYEILYWVIDHQLKGGDSGRFVGSSIWMRFDKDAPLTEIQIAQEVQSIYYLDLRFRPHH